MRALLKRGIKYIGVNGGLLPLNLAMGWMLYRVGMKYEIAYTIGFLIHVMLEFLINRQWTFRRTDLKRFPGLMRGLCVQGSALCLMVLTMRIGIDIIGAGEFLARIAAVFVCGVWCFVLDHLFTFRTKFYENT